MRRRLFAVASAISLLLCLATVALWVRSHATSDALTLVWVRSRAHVIHGLMIDSEWGCIVVIRSRVVVLVPEWSDGMAEKAEKSRGWEQFPASQGRYGQGFWRDLGFRYSAQTRSFGNAIDSPSTATGLTEDTTLLMMPDWLVILVGAVLPAWCLTRWVQRFRRRRQNHCSVCSYNLTGNTSGICPECGTPVPEGPANESPRPV